MLKYLAAAQAKIFPFLIIYRLSTDFE